MSTATANAISVDVDEAAARTSLSPTTIRAAIKDGELIARYSGSKLIVRVVDLEAWIDALPTRRVT